MFNSSWEDRGVLANLTHAVGRGFIAASWQTDGVRNAGRPRNNSQTVRFYYPFETSHRFTTSYDIPAWGDFRQVVFTGFLGTYKQRTDQDRFATAVAGRSVERADVAARDVQFKGSAQRLVGTTRVEFGGDVNGRYGLELRGSFRNLLNDSYYASPDPRWVWAPGRSASLTGVVTF